MVVLVYNFFIINNYFTQIRVFDVHYEEVYKYKKFKKKNLKKNLEVSIFFNTISPNHILSYLFYL